MCCILSLSSLLQGFLYDLDKVSRSGAPSPCLATSPPHPPSPAQPGLGLCTQGGRGQSRYWRWLAACFLGHILSHRRSVGQGHILARSPSQGASHTISAFPASEVNRALPASPGVSCQQGRSWGSGTSVGFWPLLSTGTTWLPGSGVAKPNLQCPEHGETASRSHDPCCHLSPCPSPCPWPVLATMPCGRAASSATSCLPICWRQTSFPAGRRCWWSPGRRRRMASSRSSGSGRSRSSGGISGRDRKTADKYIPYQLDLRFLCPVPDRVFLFVQPFSS